MNNIWNSIIPTLVGIIAGVTTQYLLSLYSEKRKRNADLKMQSYVDFVRNISEIGIAQRSKDAKKEAELSGKLLDAKSRIAIYGTKKVVDSLAAFLKDSGGMINNEHQKRMFIDVYQNMRKENQRIHVNDNAISLLLFNKEM